MLFSVIVPIYNVEEYLSRCVESVLGQTFTDFELILVDDGSPDNCPQMCDDWAKKDSRVKVIHKQNGGLSDARNVGVKNASGKYVLFVDGDDLITENSLEGLSKYANTDAEVLICNGKTVGGNYNLLHIETPQTVTTGADFLKSSLLQGRMPMVACLHVIKREFMIKNGLEFKKGIRHEDEEFTPRLFFKAGSVINTCVDLYRYIVREGSITTSKDLSQNARDLFETLKTQEEVYRKVEDEEFKNLLLDGLVTKYLSLYFQGRLDKKGKEFVKKDFIKRNAKSKRNKKKARLYCFSPKLYCMVNALSKRIRGAK